jgi:uncharacterized delta-60 repeat protein
MTKVSCRLAIAFCLLVWQSGCTSSNRTESSVEDKLTVSISPQVVRVRQGSSNSAMVVVQRLGNLRGDVRIEAADLPQGVRMDPSTVTIPAAADSALITIAASMDAGQGGPIPVKLRAVAMGGALITDFEPSVVVAGEPGTLDTSFNDNGKLNPVIGNLESLYIQGMAVQPDGKLVAVGSGMAGADQRAFVARFLPDGNLDPDFKNGPSVKDEVADYGSDYMWTFDRPDNVKLLEDGSILAMGTGIKSHDQNQRELFVRRFTSTGELSSSLGGDGEATIEMDRGIILRPSGYFVFEPPNNIRSFNSDGTDVANWGGAQGTPVSPFGVAELGRHRLPALDAQGRLWFVAGYTPGLARNLTSGLTLHRLEPNGSTDSTFGSGLERSIGFDKVYSITDKVWELDVTYACRNSRRGSRRQILACVATFGRSSARTRCTVDG